MANYSGEAETLESPAPWPITQVLRGACGTKQVLEEIQEEVTAGG